MGKVAIIGMGYVGLPLAILASEKKYEVFGIDINEAKINQLKNKKSPIIDPNISKKLKHTEVTFSTSFKIVGDADIIVICVPTPVYPNFLPNLEPVKSAATQIASYLKRNQLIILESTVNPGVSEEIVIPILEQNSHLKAGQDFFFAHCPERINPGDQKWTLENIPRVVGSLDQTGLQKALRFYESIIENKIKPMNSLKEAEAVKIVENSFRDINIAFVNELAKSFHHLNIDVVNVIEGAATKPFSFMPHYPGCGVGGHCIPVDPYYLIEYAKKNGFNHDLLSWARRINNSMPEFTLELLSEGLNQINKSIKGTKVALLGLSYKPNIDDCRESPAFQILQLLKEKEADIITYDPYVKNQSSAKTLKETMNDAQAIIIATAHDEFKNLKLNDFLSTKVKVIIDGRNCLDMNSFNQSDIIYLGIGRKNF